jgi:RNA polymerase sigma-70 factor, ECF subfamily
MPPPPVQWVAMQELVAAAPSACAGDLEREVMGLFDQLRGRLLRYILSFNLAEQDGEEIVQEVFLSLFRHLQMGRSRRNLRGWIFRVAHNLALKRRQANQKLRDKLEFEGASRRSAVDTSLNPEERLITEQHQQRLQAVFQALPEQDQCCLRLRADGLRYREIAQVLDISLGAVALSLARSLERLARASEI